MSSQKKQRHSVDRVSMHITHPGCHTLLKIALNGRWQGFEETGFGLWGLACMRYLFGWHPAPEHLLFHHVWCAFELASGLGRSPPHLDPSKKDTQSSEQCITSGDETSTEVCHYH